MNNDSIAQSRIAENESKIFSSWFSSVEYLAVQLELSSKSIVVSGIELDDQNANLDEICEIF